MGGFVQFFYTTGFAYIEWGNLVMVFIALIFIWLALTKGFEPLLLIPIGFGMLFANMPGMSQMFQSIDSEGSVFGFLYKGVAWGIYPSLIFLGIGAMTDFSALIANPKLIFLGAAAQFGIFSAFLGANLLGFTVAESASIGIIGGADGPTAIFLTNNLAPHLIGAIALAAYSYMALVPIIQPPVIKLLTNDEERIIRMKNPRIVSKREKILFPIIGFIATVLIAPGGATLLGMLFFGNLLKESGVTERLANTARTTLIDICTILVGFCIGATTTAGLFLNMGSIKIFLLGAFAFTMATAMGVIGGKFMNLFLKEKINPIIGAAGVSAVPMSARVAHKVGLEYDKSNYLLMHAMAPNVAGVIGSAVVAGILLGILG
ncbi:MAG: sodium ion-translocating decarboxylase subunit beta [Candidatus Cloacimonetes bacterium]|nr:sodium ion-translocating decarboxylase subunit beta [Candidatus Cloacimonadota bacterium]